MKQTSKTRSRADDTVKKADKIAQNLQEVKTAIQSVIFGQDDVVDQTLVTLLSGGHCLLIGLPGLAKTKLVNTVSTVMGLDHNRVQCTPDLMPSDILGSEVLEEGKDKKRSFRFIKGPVFCQMLMADEINRANPRTQSALLQAMQEKQVTIAGEDYDLPKPFHVFATQNPIEQEGTYPLPEAQLDRFMLQINVTYPDEAAEQKMLISTTGAKEASIKKKMGPKDLIEAQSLVRKMPITEELTDIILKLVRNGRPDSTDLKTVSQNVNWGPGPRASQTFSLAIRARALLDGRLAPSIDDVTALAYPILRHRMSLNFAAKAEGIKIEDVIRKLLNLIE